MPCLWWRFAASADLGASSASRVAYCLTPRHPRAVAAIAAGFAINCKYVIGFQSSRRVALVRQQPLATPLRRPAGARATFSSRQVPNSNKTGRATTNSGRVRRRKLVKNGFGQRGEKTCLLSGAHDVARRHAGQPVCLAELGGERVPITAGWAACYEPLMLIAGRPSRSFPGSIVGHWTLNGEDAPVVVNDDEEERGGWSRARARDIIPKVPR